MEINDYYSKVNSLRDVYGNPITFDRWDKDHPSNHSQESAIELIKQVNNPKTISKKKEVFVSIMPTWHCTNNCYYCYLGKLRDSKKVATLKQIEQRLKELTKAEYAISQISLYGGEISTLDKQYLIDLITLCKQYAPVSCQTNLQDFKLFSICQTFDIPISVSINKERPNNYLIEQFVKHIGNCDVNVVVLPSVLELFENQVCDWLDELRVKSVHFYQYSPSYENACHFKLTNKMYEDFMCNVIRYWADNRRFYSFDIANVHDQLDFTLDNKLFIDPWARFCSIDYIRGREQFKVHKSLKDYEEFITKEHVDYQMCLDCKLYKTDCQAKRIRPHFNYDEDVCSGLPHLIECIKEVREELTKDE